MCTYRLRPVVNVPQMPEFLFETPRLHVRQLQPCDIDALHAVYGDADAMRWVGNGRPLLRSQCEEWMSVTQRNYRTRGYGMLALVEKQSQVVIGFCGLVHPGGQLEAEIKYALRRECWGKGFASEAASALLNYGASTCGLKHVMATTAPENRASQRVLLKAGMVMTGLRREEDGSFTQMYEWLAPADDDAP